MKKLLILLFGVFSSIVGYAQSSLQFGFSSNPIFTDFTSSVNEFNDINNEKAPFDPKDFGLNHKFSYGWSILYSNYIIENLNYNFGFSHNVFRYDYLKNGDYLSPGSFNNTLAVLGLSYPIYSKNKNRLFCNLNVQYLIGGRVLPVFISFWKDSNLSTNDQVYRTVLSSSIQRSPLSSLFLNFNIRYLYNITKTSGIGLNIGYTSTFTQPYSLQFESAWKRPGEDFFTKVEKTETSRFNFGFMNVGISYVYQFKKKEK
jgi:hypothetical protein